MKKIPLYSLMLLCLLLTTPGRAEVKLPAIVSSDMVLQRNATVTLWGWAEAGKKITIKASWLNTPLQITTDKSGNWKTGIQTTNDKKPQTINITGDGSNILLENILFGEVWLCSGQSNMQQPLNGYTGQPVFGALEAISSSKNPNLRLFTVDRIGSKTPLKDVEKYTGWQAASPETVKDFSAIAYFYGQRLQEILDVPVGMIHTSWGGSSVQAWLSKEAMENYQKVDLDGLDITKRTNHIPTALYNSMIHPLIPYTIKGALWYQGESNREEPENYKKLFPAMVKDWRTRWDLGDFPFYYVQIAPFIYDGNEVFSTANNSAFIRETQLQCLDLIPNSGMAVTMDIGDDYCIHPPKKKEVADRLLYIALNKTYGFNTLDYVGPTFASFEAQEDGLLLKFDNADTGLFSYEGLQGFEIAGKDRVFYPADATIIDRKNVLVKNTKVPNPAAVRYAWRNWVVGTLYDTNLLPASSFRTDDWNDATKATD
ncbi:sialate O-acetylesterase [Maribacter sp. ANRC-HE7]|uniref:Sialate O-acetylesterase n=1 Tax=Maribacter aquimaris TaxID=2737171 RepID=A0ABR7V0C0_9FLAO|nr:sialate O-acetylesterase [Maribacter aquimaris]MBD0778016.1 sialate O-acetylesterase [Maribacter aquimaris]